MLLDLAKSRRTVRKFKSESFPVDKIIRCIEVAREAPSGINKQPWYFLIVKDPEKKREIRRRCEKFERDLHRRVRGELKEWMEKENITWRKDFLEEAPYLVMIFSDIRAPYSRESTWLAVGYFLLALEEEGLSSLTYTPSPAREIAEVVNAPRYYRLETILPVGYPKEGGRKKRRKELQEIMDFDSF